MDNLLKQQIEKWQYDKFMAEVNPYLKQIEPAIDSYINAKYKDSIKIKKSPYFEIEQSKITDFIAMFINDTITNTELKKKLLDNLYNRNPNLILNLKTNPPKLNMTANEEREWHKSTAGRISINEVDGKNFTTQDIGKIDVRVRLGISKSNGKIETNIHNIVAYLHEITHSISERNTSPQPIAVKEDCSSEIESMFMENLFMHYLSNNAVQLSNLFYKEKTIPNADPIFIKNIVKNYQAEHDKGLQDILKMIKYEPYNSQDPKHKQNEFRYLIGDIYSYVLNDAYKKNPTATLDRYAEFLKNNASLTLDESSKILFGNNKITKKDIITKFANKLENQINNLLQENQINL